MNESEWRECREPQRMLDLVRGRASQRKLRLLACACVRAMMPLLFDDRSRRAVEVAERFADGGATEEELRAAEEEAFGLGRGADYSQIQSEPPWAAAWAAGRVGYRDAFLAARDAAVGLIRSRDPWTYSPAGELLLRGDPAAAAVAGAATCDLIREVVGYPFREVELDDAWLRWGGGVAVAVARSIYDERRFGELPILADALEDAGCDDARLLRHLRGGDHVLGCWALDVVLGRS